MVIFVGRPLIYILIGGSANAFRFVKRALAKKIPVIIATVIALKVKEEYKLHERYHWK